MKHLLVPLGINGTYVPRPSLGVYGMNVFDRRIKHFFAAYEIFPGSKRCARIPLLIRQNIELTIAFIRGLFDTDGSLFFNKSTGGLYSQPRIRFANVSWWMIRDVYVALRTLQIHCRLRTPYQGKRDAAPVYSIEVHRQSAVQMFMQQIGSSNLKHSTKWILFMALGFCLPRTSLHQRLTLISQQLLNTDSGSTS